MLLKSIGNLGTIEFSHNFDIIGVFKSLSPSDSIFNFLLNKINYAQASTVLNEFFTGFAFIDESFENSFDFYKISKDNYDILRSYSYGIKHLLQHLQFREY